MYDFAQVTWSSVRIPVKGISNDSQVFCVSKAGDSRMLGLACILTVAICGLFAVPAWSVPVAALALATVSYARHQALFRRAADLGMQEAIDQTLVGSLLHGLIASMAAYGCGAALRFLSVGF